MASLRRQKPFAPITATVRILLRFTTRVIGKINDASRPIIAITASNSISVNPFLTCGCAVPAVCRPKVPLMFELCVPEITLALTLNHNQAMSIPGKPMGRFPATAIAEYATDIWKEQP
jgi:hypothetical protein